MPLAEIAFAISSQIWAIGQIVPGMAQYRLQKSQAANAAVAAMRGALSATSMFLKDPDFSKSKKLLEISNLWNTASEKVGVVNKSLGESLGMKSRFWSDHELFIRHGQDKDVMSLQQVSDEIERLYLQMK